MHYAKTAAVLSYGGPVLPAERVTGRRRAGRFERRELWLSGIPAGAFALVRPAFPVREQKDGREYE